MPKKKLPTKTYVGFGLSMLDRAVKESFALRCGVVDLEKIEAFCSHDGHIRCAYCDAPDPNCWDHLHPVSLGGDTVPGNLVPACGRCDDSKQDRTIEEWALSVSAYRPSAERLKKIQNRLAAYQAKFAYAPRQFVDKLSIEQRRTYDVFQEKPSVHETVAYTAHRLST